jgi:hypothetical protein
MWHSISRPLRVGKPPKAVIFLPGGTSEMPGTVNMKGHFDLVPPGAGIWTVRAAKVFSITLAITPTA